MMRRLIYAFIIAFAVRAHAQHPITFENLAAIHRIGAPQISPDGRTIAYDASTPDLAANSSHSAVFLVTSSGGQSARIAEGGSPVWSPDGKNLAFISGNQVHLYSNGSTRKVTDLQGGAASVKWLPDGSGLVVVSDIYPDCGVDPTCIKSRVDAAGKAPTKARVITSLLYRHWKAWQEPTRTHIVYVPLNGGSARDLTPGAFDAPPFS